MDETVITALLPAREERRGGRKPRLWTCNCGEVLVGRDRFRQHKRECPAARRWEPMLDSEILPWEPEQ